MDLDVIAFVLQMAGIAFLGGGMLLSAWSQQHVRREQFEEWKQRKIELNRSVGHPEWTPAEWNIVKAPK